MFGIKQFILTGLLLYLDPGSGSFLIQLLLAAILGIGVAVRLYWGKIKAIFASKTPPSEQALRTPTEGEDIED